jgi:putative Mg2+ transporter-C (MgtC) family protein
MELLIEDITKLLLAVVVGGIIGAEREIRGRAAGFRTIILICVGSTLFTIISMKIGGAANPDRIASNIITGIGFIGAGVIFHGQSYVSGITTAATIWIAAALGMSIGGGHFLLAGYTTLMVMVVLWGFSKLDVLIDNARQSRSYEIVLHNGQDKLNQVLTLARECGLRIKERGLAKRGSDIMCVIDARGTAKSHSLLAEKLLADADIVEFRF